MSYDVEQLIKDASHTLEDVAGDEKINATHFNVFRYIEPNEMVLSWILSDLLDPTGKHGQRDHFVRSLLRSVGFQVPEFDCIKVRTEAVTTHLLGYDRRHDILLTGKAGNKSVWQLSIENKLKGAGDQREQLADYLADIESRDLPAYLIYLTLDGTRPSAESIDPNEWIKRRDEGRVVCLSATQLAAWLEVEAKNITPTHVVAFLNQFRQYLKETLVSKPVEPAIGKVLQLADSREGLESALLVMRAQDALREKLMAKAMNDIESALPEGWCIKKHLSLSTKALEIAPPHVQNWHLCLEAQSASRCNAWIWGVKRATMNFTGEEGQNLDALGEMLRVRLDRRCRTSAWWPYYRDFSQGVRGLPVSEAYQDWEANSQPWLDMQSGVFATSILELFTEIVRALDLQ